MATPPISQPYRQLVRHAFVHSPHPSPCNPNFRPCMRGRVHREDHTRFSWELHLSHQHRVQACCKTSNCCPHTSADVSQALQISRDLCPRESHCDSMSYLQPIKSAYEESSYEGMKTAIFPSYFHGKCQRDGVDPPGCPNPDCPVVCGTPGSLVHFYPKLRFIAYDHTRNTMQQLCSPGNKAYEQSEYAFEQAAGRPHRREGERRRVPWFEYAATGAGRELARSAVHGRSLSYAWKREEEGTKKQYQKYMGRIPMLLEEACGGRATEDEDGLPECSWQKEMKEYILTFP